MNLTLREEMELERLLLMLEHWEKIANPATPALQPPTPVETGEKSAKPRELKPAAEEPAKDFIDQLCGPGSDKPGGKAREKHGWMD